MSINEVELSDLSKIAGFIAWKYKDALQCDLKNEKPLILGIPYKGNLANFLSIIVLKNFFNQDYLEFSDDSFHQEQLKDQDRIKIFGQPTYWTKGRNSKYGYFHLKQNSTNISRQLLPEYLPYLEKLSSGSRVAKFDTFYNQVRLRRQTSNSLDKFLEFGKSGLGFPESCLKSQILLVTGRGKKTKTLEWFKKNNAFDKSYYELLVKNEKLQILPDFKSYSSCFDNSQNSRIQSYKDRLLRLINIVGFVNAELREEINSNNFNSEKFENGLEELETLINERDNKGEINEFQKLIEIKPIEEVRGILENVKSVIITNPELLDEFPQTINGFLKNKIPVIVITSFTDDLKNLELADSFRFFYSRAKIGMLIKPRNIYLDNRLVELNNNIINNDLKVRLFEDKGYCDLLNEITRAIYHAHELERLKIEFWQSLYPCLFFLKNAPSHSLAEIENLAKDFFKCFNELKDLLPENIKELITDLLKSNWTNQKELKGKNIFNPIYKISDTNLKLEIDYPKRSKSKISPSKSLTFSGMPYKEYVTNYVWKSLFEIGIKKISMSLFPNEAQRLSHLISTTLGERLFSDNLPFIEELDKSLTFSDNNISEWINDVNAKFELAEEEKNKVLDFNNDILHKEYLFNRYKSYVSSNAEYVLDCITLNFTNEEWMFAPKSGKFSSLQESESEEIEIKEISTLNIKPNDILIFYNLDVSQLTDLASSNGPLSSHISNLEIWRNAIREGIEKLGYKKLSAKLSAIKKEKKFSNSNPSTVNLGNWKNDEDLISPSRYNLELILAYLDKSDQLESIWNSRRTVLSFRYEIRKQIKEKLKSKLPKMLKKKKNEKDSMNIAISGVDIQIDIRQISFVDKETLKVDYSDTKKLISE